MNLSWIILITIGTVNLGLVSLIIVKQRRALKNIINVTFIFSVVFLLLWSLFNFLADNSTDLPMALLWTKLTFPPSLFALFLFLWFSYAFPAKIQNYGKQIIGYSLLTVGFSILAMSNYVIEGVELHKNIGISDINLGVAYPAIMAFYALLIGNTIYNLYVKYKTTHGLRKTQVKYVILGWGLFLLGATIPNLILPYFTGNADWSKFGPFFSIFMVGFITYAIVRHHLMDIRIVIQRGLIYTSLLVFLVGFYLTAVFAVGYIFQKVTDVTILISAGLTVIVCVFGVPPLKRCFEKITDKFFFKNKYDYSQAMQELSEILNKNISLQNITGKTSQKIKQIMKTDKVIFSIARQEKGKNPGGTKSSSKELKINITLENEPVGSIVLGEKLSGDPYTKEDVKLLKTFAYQAGVALKKAELYAQMKNYSRELEEEVAQRTAKIEDLHKEQQQIVMDISHGLQTPLTIIKSELGLLQKQKINPENFAILEKSIDRISKFIYDLLKLARLEKLEGGFKKEKVNLSHLLEDLIDEFEIVTEEKNITIENDISPDITILGDESNLAEMITNLVSNAVKYTANERKIFINLREDNNIVTLTVKDTGIGISAQDLPNVFNRFYRVKETGHVGTKGTGLGLAICKKIVEGHKGIIEAKSALGKGTTLTVTFTSNH